MFSKKVKVLGYLQTELKTKSIVFKKNQLSRLHTNRVKGLFSKWWNCVMNSIVFKKNRNWIMNSIVFEKTRIFSFEFVKLYISIVLCCFIIIQKNTEKTTTQYNTITQYNLVKFKGFFAGIVFCYCIVLCSRYCIVFKKTINGTMNSITALCCFQNN